MVWNLVGFSRDAVLFTVEFCGRANDQCPVPLNNNKMLKRQVDFTWKGTQIECNFQKPGLKKGIDFSGRLWKQVWEMAYFGLKSGQDLEGQAAHPH